MFDYNLGKHCSDPYCHQKDFLPYHCDVCKHVYCSDHRVEHECQGLSELNERSMVPTCPVCSHIVPKRFPTENNNLVIQRHLESGECGKGKVVLQTVVPTRSKDDFCHMKSCKHHHNHSKFGQFSGASTTATTLDFLFIQCNYCNDKFCLDHRVPEDHQCKLLKTRNQTTALLQQREALKANTTPKTTNTNTSLSGRLHLQRVAQQLSLKKQSSSETIQPKQQQQQQSGTVKLKKRLPKEPIQFVNTPQSAIMPTHRPNLEREDQLHVPVFLPLNHYQPMYMYFPAMSSVGKVVDMICSYAKLDIVDRKSGGRLRLFSMTSGKMLPMASQLRQLVKDGELVDNAPILFEYTSDDTSGISEQAITELQQYLNHSTKQTLTRKCGAVMRVIDGNRNQVLFVR